MTDSPDAAAVPAPPRSSEPAGLAAGLDVVEVAIAEPFVEVRRDPRASARRRGCTAGWPSPTASPPAPPIPGSPCPTPPPSSSAPGATSSTTPSPASARRPAGRIARYAWDDHYAHLKTGLKAVAAVLKADGWRARVLADDNAMVDRAAAHRAGIGWWGKNANLLLPGLGSWYVLGSVVTDAPLPPTVERRSTTAAAPAAAASTAARPAPSPRRAWSTPGAACPGCSRPRGRSRSSTASRSATASTAATSARRCARRTGGPRCARRRATRRPWADLRRRCSTPTTTWCSRRARPLVHPAPRGPLRAAQRARRARQRRRRARPGRRRAARRATSRHADPLLRGHAVWAARRLGREDLLAAARARDRSRSSSPSWSAAAPMTHLFVTNDFPPKVGGIQTMLWELWRRLDPTSFTVLTTPYDGDAAWDADAALPRRADQGEGAPPDAVARPPHRRPGRRGRRRRRGARSRPARRAARPAPAPPVRRRAPRRRGHGARPAARPEPRAAPRAPRRRARDRGGRLPAGRGRARRRPAAAERARAARRRHRALPSARRRRASAPPATRFGLPVDGPPRREPEPARAPQGDGRPDQGRPRCWRPRHPDLTVAIGGGGRDRGAARPARRVAPARPVRLLGRVSATTTCPRFYGCADVYAMLCRNRWAGLEQEGFGIVFLEAAAAGVPQVAGDSGGAAEAVVHGETGLVVERPRRRRRRGRRARRAARPTPSAARGWASAGRERAVAEFTYDGLAARLGDARWRQWEAGAPWLTTAPAPSRPPARQARVRRHRRRSSSPASRRPPRPTPSASVHAGALGRAVRRRHRRPALGLRPRRVPQPHRARSASRACSSWPATSPRAPIRRALRGAHWPSRSSRWSRPRRSGPTPRSPSGSSPRCSGSG